MYSCLVNRLSRCSKNAATVPTMAKAAPISPTVRIGINWTANETVTYPSMTPMLVHSGSSEEAKLIATG